MPTIEFTSFISLDRYLFSNKFRTLKIHNLNYYFNNFLNLLVIKCFYQGACVVVCKKTNQYSYHWIHYLANPRKLNLVGKVLRTVGQINLVTQPADTSLISGSSSSNNTINSNNFFY